MSLLTLQNVSKSFGERVLFENVSFSIENNTKMGFIGANGVGKTTLFRTITGEEDFEGNIVKSSDLIIYGNDIGIEASDKIVERFKRSDLSAGGNVNINTEGRYCIIGVEFGIGVHGKMALVKMSCYAFLFNGRRHSIAEVAGFVDSRAYTVLIRDKESCRSALRFIILL